jgi:hypothetical protein
MPAHRLMSRLFVVLAAGVVSSATASAGPMIAYGVSSEFQQRGLFPLWGQLQAGPGGFVNAPVGAENTFAVGSAGRQPGPIPMLLPRRFGLDVTIFDQASGQYGTLEFEGFANERLDISIFPPGIDRQAQFFGLNALGGNSLTFGGRTYEVELSVREGAHGRAYVDANVTVNTPEPGTLALAGIGLGFPAAGCLARRVRGRAN